MFCVSGTQEPKILLELYQNSFGAPIIKMSSLNYGSKLTGTGRISNRMHPGQPILQPEETSTLLEVPPVLQSDK